MRPALLAAAITVALGNTATSAAPLTAASDPRVGAGPGAVENPFVARVAVADGTDADGSTPDRGFDESSGDPRLDPPRNLRLSVYSDTAAELFWERPASAAGSESTDIVRDGVPIASVADGTSFFDDTRVPGRRYRYAVRFFYPTDAVSPVATVDENEGTRTPAPPANLRAERYSASAGEVFWDRVLGARLSYEVSVDGEPVATTDGTSFFVERPEGGVGGAEVGVVAIGPDGSRSGPSSMRFAGEPPVSEETDPESDADAPPRPTNARIELYSGTTAELSWNRAPVDGRDPVVGARVARDGVEIATTDGTSFLDDTRVPGRPYRYEIAFMTRSGAMSAPAVVGRGDGRGGELPGSVGDSPLGLANADALLAGIVGVIDRNPATALDRALPLPSFTPPRNFGGRRAGPPEPAPNGDGEQRIVQCERGSYTVEDIDAQSESFLIEFDGCTSAGLTLDGRTGVILVNPRFHRALFEDLRISGSEGGDARISTGFLSSSSSADLDRAQDTLLNLDYVQGDVRVDTLTQFEVDAFGSSPRTSLVLGFEVTAPWTGGQALSVDTLTLLRGGGEGSPNYSTGTLSVVDANGSSLLVDADTGDVSTYAVTSTILGTATSEIRSWTPATSPRCLTVPERSGNALAGCEAAR